MNSERNSDKSRIDLTVLNFVYSVLKLLDKMDTSLTDRCICHDGESRNLCA